MYYYAVKKGRIKGIYNSWKECLEQVDGYPGAVYKKFALKSEAENFLQGDSFVALKKEIVEGNFNIDLAHVLEPDEYYIYTDGSYSDSKYAWAFVVLYAGEVIHNDYGVGTDEQAAKTRNIAGELTAVMRACVWAKNKKVKRITIRHDLQGVAFWARGEWKRNNNVTEQYYNFMQKYIKEKFVVFEHVRGHSGNEYNDMADKLAKQAIVEYKENNDI